MCTAAGLASGDGWLGMSESSVVEANERNQVPDEVVVDYRRWRGRAVACEQVGGRESLDGGRGRANRRARGEGRLRQSRHWPPSGGRARHRRTAGSVLSSKAAPRWAR